MAKHWYMYVNDKFITESVGCIVCLNKCPAVRYAEDSKNDVVYEPLVNQEFNINVKQVACPDTFKRDVLKICNACKQRLRIR